jgi:hypothetical protein
MTYLWVALAAAITFFAPNTQEIAHRFHPALGSFQPRSARGPRLHFTWQWGAAIGVLAAAELLSLSRPTEFLYFQF